MRGYKILTGAVLIAAATVAIVAIASQGDRPVIDDPNAKITVDGTAVEIVSRGDEGFGRFTGQPGKIGYEWKVERDGETFHGFLL